MQLTQNVSIQTAVTVAAGVDAKTNIEGTVIDTQGFDGVAILARFGAITSGAATSIKAQHGDAANLSDAADITGTAQTVADTASGKLFVVDIFRPVKRYVRLYVSRATQNSVVAATALLYTAGDMPVTHGADVAVEAFVSPVTGTA